MPVERIVQHRHCIQCGKAIPPGEKFCSERCKEEYEALVEHRKRLYIIFLLLAALTIILLIL